MSTLPPVVRPAILAGRTDASSSLRRDMTRAVYGLVEPRNSAATVIHQFAESLGAAIDAKDSHTSLHSEEVAEIAQRIALAMGLSPGVADLIHVAGHLHDIGKIGVPDAVLGKQGPLSVAEWKLVRRHPDMGAEILDPVPFFKDTGIVDMVRHHHERYDGKGYPGGLRSAGIPLGARIIAVADSLSAILQDRPYRVARSFESACLEIRHCSGTQFDPIVVNAFLKVKDEVKAMMQGLRGNAPAAVSRS